MGDLNLPALLDVVSGHLGASGNSTGLGHDLKGLYAKTWQEIVEKLGS
jgi:hypothetical protein